MNLFMGNIVYVNYKKQICRKFDGANKEHNKIFAKKYNLYLQVGAGNEKRTKFIK